MEFLHFYIKEGTATLTPTYNNYVTLQYSFDKTEWTTAETNVSIDLVPNKKVYFKGTIVNAYESGSSFKFEATGSPLYAGGSIMSLQDGNPNETTITKIDNQFRFLFRDCTTLVTPPELPATTLKYGCYIGMFYGCTSLTTAPALPATRLANYCYNGMLSNCTSLTTAPKLSATSLAEGCYSGMLSGCTSLTTAPSLPATTLANNCYGQMFYGCTSLKTAPSLPATTLKLGCYQSMFEGCTSITTAPKLPATS